MWQYMTTCGNTFSVPFEILTVYAKNSLPNPAPRFRDKFLETEVYFEESVHAMVVSVRERVIKI